MRRVAVSHLLQGVWGSRTSADNRRTFGPTEKRC